MGCEDPCSSTGRGGREGAAAAQEPSGLERFTTSHQPGVRRGLCIKLRASIDGSGV